MGIVVLHLSMSLDGFVGSDPERPGAIPEDGHRIEFVQWPDGMTSSDLADPGQDR